MTTHNSAALAPSQFQQLHPALEQIRSARPITPLPNLGIEMAIPGFATAADYIADVIRTKHSDLTIFCDSDVDGISSCAQLALYLRLHGIQPAIRSAKREKGYGYLFDDGDRADIILLDLGTNDSKQVKLARNAGRNVICIDHHINYGRFAGTLLVNPGGSGPYKGLCTAGLVHHLLRSVDQRLGFCDAQLFADLAMLGTLADQCNMSDALNRQLVTAGLQKAHQHGFVHGVQLLVDALGLGGTDAGAYTCQNVSWDLVPCLNAPGRLGDCGPSLLLALLGRDDLNAAGLVREIVDLNDLRKRLRKQAISEAAGQIDLSQPVAIVHGRWAPGIVGLVAGHFKDKYGVPTIAFGPLDNNTYKGSARLPEAYAFDSLIDPGRHLLSGNAGGHRGAGGMTISAVNLDAFRTAVTQAATMAGMPPANDISHELTWDADVAIGDLTSDFYKQLYFHVGPFGRGYPTPTLRIPNAQVLSRWGFGQNREHTSLTLTDHTNKQIRATYFNAPDVPDQCDILGTVKHYRGQVELNVMGVVL